MQGFDDFWASNPQNRGHQLAGASRDLHRSTTLRPPRLIQPPHSNPCPMARSNTLRELDFDRMPSDDACPTVHRSTASSSPVNPKHSTWPRPLPGYQWETLHWRSCVLLRPYTRPPPLADGRVRQFITPPPTQVSPIQIVARSLAAICLSKGDCTLDELHRPVEP